eukprot:COSAG02_NODE_5622_length_4175_cov_13.084642_3_plen_207_part_00
MPFWLGVACHPKVLVGYVTLVRRYATWAALGGITDLYDSVAAAAGLPQVDSYNMWPMLSGSNGTSPRSEIVIGSHIGGDEAGGTTTVVAALIRPPWKLIIGEGPGDILDMAGWAGEQSPNTSATVEWRNLTQRCGRTAQTGCLYDILADPHEIRNVAMENAEKWNELHTAVQKLNATVYSPERGGHDGTACNQALENGNFWGPFLP